MTVQEVKQRVELIRASAGNDEGAHILQDQLYADVLRAIEKREGDEPAALALAALEVENIDFRRWYA